jgi:hypothetical protein
MIPEALDSTALAPVVYISALLCLFYVIANNDQLHKDYIETNNTPDPRYNINPFIAPLNFLLFLILVIVVGHYISRSAILVMMKLSIVALIAISCISIFVAIVEFSESESAILNEFSHILFPWIKTFILYIPAVTGLIGIVYQNWSLRRIMVSFSCIVTWMIVIESTPTDHVVSSLDQWKQRLGPLRVTCLIVFAFGNALMAIGTYTSMKSLPTHRLAWSKGLPDHRSSILTLVALVLISPWYLNHGYGLFILLILLPLLKFNTSKIAKEPEQLKLIVKPIKWRSVITGILLITFVVVMLGKRSVYPTDECISLRQLDAHEELIAKNCTSTNQMTIYASVMLFAVIIGFSLGAPVTTPSENLSVFLTIMYLIYMTALFGLKNINLGIRGEFGTHQSQQTNQQTEIIP